MISVARVPTHGDLQRSVCGWNGIGRRRGAWGAATLSAASLRREPPSWRTRPTNSGHSMNARHRPGSAADRADTPWKDLMTDALRYGEPRRLVYNGVLAVLVLAGAWPVLPSRWSGAGLLGPPHAVRPGGHRQCGLLCCLSGRSVPARLGVSRDGAALPVGAVDDWAADGGGVHRAGARRPARVNLWPGWVLAPTACGRVRALLSSRRMT